MSAPRSEWRGGPVLTPVRSIMDTGIKVGNVAVLIEVIDIDRDAARETFQRTTAQLSIMLNAHFERVNTANPKD